MSRYCPECAHSLVMEEDRYLCGLCRIVLDPEQTLDEVECQNLVDYLESSYPLDAMLHDFAHNPKDVQNYIPWTLDELFERSALDQ